MKNILQMLEMTEFFSVIFAAIILVAVLVVGIIMNIIKLRKQSQGQYVNKAIRVLSIVLPIYSLVTLGLFALAIISVY